MRQYRIGDLTTGKGYVIQASSARVALDRAFRQHMDEFMHEADFPNEKMLTLLVSDQGESIQVRRVTAPPAYWYFNGGAWVGREVDEVKRVLKADGIPDGWHKYSLRSGNAIQQDTCGICGAKSPQEEQHLEHAPYARR